MAICGTLFQCENIVNNGEQFDKGDQMIKKHKKSILVVTSVFLGAGAWAQLSSAPVFQSFSASLAAPGALGTEVVLTPPAFTANVSAAEAPVLIAQVSAPQPTTATAPAAPTFSASMSPEALSAAIAAQVAQGKDLESVLKEARAAGVQDVAFASAAAKAGVSVAAITTTVIKASADPAAALSTLGQAFSGDQVALQSVLATAVTISTVTLSPSVVQSAIESGATTVIAQATTTTSTAAPAVEATAPSTTSATTTSSSVGGGGGSGGSTPISPS